MVAVARSVEPPPEGSTYTFAQVTVPEGSLVVHRVVAWTGCSLPPDQRAYWRSSALRTALLVTPPPLLAFPPGIGRACHPPRRRGTGEEVLPPQRKGMQGDKDRPSRERKSTRGRWAPPPPEGTGPRKGQG